MKNYQSSLLALVLFVSAAQPARADEPATISDRGSPLSRAKSAEELVVPQPALMISSQALPNPQAAPKVAAVATPDVAPAPPTISSEKPIRITERLAWPWRIAAFLLLAACGLLFLRIRR